MTLLSFDLHQRRLDTAPGTSLGAIADGLAVELQPWMYGALPVPVTKARLTISGGRCPTHGVLLDFDPASPHAHRCPVCHVVYTGREHHEWWVMGAHLFTAERAVHAAALHLLRGDENHRTLAEHTLERLAAQYGQWPNRDNALGPTRPFFSTYLESIWLLNVCHALSLLERAGHTRVSGPVREHILHPSSALIASFHEQRSNRQAWNEVAILSALTLLGEARAVHARLEAPGSLFTLLDDGLLTDGTWYEGENYHQFAHRGLWYGVQLLEALGRPLEGDRRARFHEGFAAPFAALLPDETLPSRRDSQYAVSMRQWRWAEWCELGYAFAPDRRLAATLHRLYDGSAPAGATGRAVSTADAERNRPAVALTRADCSWRALLMANVAPVPPASWTPGSVLQPRQGVAVLRREAGRVYVALDGGEQGGGHGHPDRLALTLQRGATRVLDDPGTGSYVERALHWYRSTLAHHAPLVNGASQQRGTTQLTAFEDRGGAGWVQKVAHDLAPGVSGTRTVVVCDGYLVDTFEFTAAHPVTVTLPVAARCRADIAAWHPAPRSGAGGLEDGYDFLADVEQAVDAPEQIELTLEGATAPAAWCAATAAGAPPVWWRATAPGAPARPPQLRLMIDLHGTSGRIVGVWRFTESVGAITAVHLTPQATAVATVTTADGTTATHEPAPHGWHIGLVARHSRSSIDLEWRTPDETETTTPTDGPPERTRPNTVLTVPAVAHHDEVATRGMAFALGEHAYVQTEEPWGGNNTPTANVRLARTAEELVVLVEAHTGHAPVMPTGGTATRMPPNGLDNERADINADGVQCYLGVAGDRPGTWRAGMLAVPLGDRGARVTSLVPAGVVPHVDGESHADGWRLLVRWPLAALPEGAITFDLIVNERPPERERRRGQLVLSGGGGFGYLRGDRHAPTAPLGLVVT